MVYTIIIYTMTYNMVVYTIGPMVYSYQSKVVYTNTTVTFQIDFDLSLATASQAEAHRA